MTVAVLCVLIHLVLPFRVEIRSGEPPYEQLIFSIKKAIADGHLKPGGKLPSVHAFSKELRINPNTVQKALSVLINEGALEVRPGIGSIVSASYKPAPPMRSAYSFAAWIATEPCPSMDAAKRSMCRLCDG